MTSFECEIYPFTENGNAESCVEILDLIIKHSNANLFLADFGVVELMCAIRLSSYAVLAFPLYVL